MNTSIRFGAVVAAAVGALFIAGCAPEPQSSGSQPGATPELLHLAKYVRAGQLLGSVPAVGTSSGAYGAVLTRTVDVAGTFAAVNGAAAAAPRAFTVGSPEGSFTYQVHPLNLTFGGSNSAATANVYTIEKDGSSVTWGEVNVARDGALSSMVILGHADGSTEIETAGDLLGQIGGPGVHTLGASGGQTWGCDLVETGCSTALSFGKDVLCVGETIDIGLAIASCVGTLFTDGATIEACMVTVVEATVAVPLCGKLSGIIEDAAGDAACKAIVGCNPALGFLGCQCEWTDPCKASMDSVCDTLASAVICSGSNALASKLVSAGDIAKAVCSENVACESIWGGVCGYFVDHTALEGGKALCMSQFGSVCGGGAGGGGGGCQPKASTKCSGGDLYWFDSCGSLGDLAQGCNGCGCTGTSCDACGPGCTPNNNTACSNGDLYWFDSCGQRGAIAQSCNGCGCTGGSCDACGPSCTPNDHVACSGGDVYWFDSCGNKGGFAQSCNGCGCSGASCSGCVSPWVGVNPTSVHRAQECMTQTLSGFSPNSVATCHPKNQWGDTTFPVSLDGSGHLDNTYCPSIGAGLGQYEFWCVDGPTGKSSNHVFFTILP